MIREKNLARREQGEVERFEPWNTFREMERMMRNFVMPFPSMRAPGWHLSDLRPEFVPEVDLRETEKEYILSATVPGLGKDDVDINVTKDTITISGERKTEEETPGERYHFRQQSYGSFNVTYSLPSDVKPSEVKATYKNGVLDVVMPKEEVVEAHKIIIEEQK